MTEQEINGLLKALVVLLFGVAIILLISPESNRSRIAALEGRIDFLEQGMAIMSDHLVDHGDIINELIRIETDRPDAIDMWYESNRN
jgi:hypothetical protein